MMKRTNEKKSLRQRDRVKKERKKKKPKDREKMRAIMLNVERRTTTNERVSETRRA